MHTSKVKQIWKDGGLAIGTLVKSIDPVHSEALSQMGFDFLWYDLEHSDKSVETFSNLARATRVGNVDILARPARWNTCAWGDFLKPGPRVFCIPDASLPRKQPNSSAGQNSTQWGNEDSMGVAQITTTDSILPITTLSKRTKILGSPPKWNRRQP